LCTDRTSGIKKGLRLDEEEIASAFVEKARERFRKKRKGIKKGKKCSTQHALIVTIGGSVRRRGGSAEKSKTWGSQFTPKLLALTSRPN